MNRDLESFRETCLKMFDGTNQHSAYVGMMNFIMSGIPETDRMEYIQVLHDCYHEGGQINAESIAS